MSVLAGDFWERAKDSLHAAEHVLPVSADTAASRAYYAAFYAGPAPEFSGLRPRSEV